MNNIYLIGFMGTGKTTVARLIAKQLHKNFLETDRIIENRQNITIAEIFKRFGEDYFRALEKEVIAEIARSDNGVVSCGGGLACNQDTIALLKRTGTVFCLVCSPEVIYERLKNETDRPLLAVSDPLLAIRTLLQARQEFYNQAHYMVRSERETPDAVASLIVALLHAKTHT